MDNDNKSSKCNVNDNNDHVMKPAPVNAVHCAHCRRLFLLLLFVLLSQFFTRLTRYIYLSIWLLVFDVNQRVE